MGTDNPKISVYVPKTLKDKIQEFGRNHDITGLSAAVVYILNEHFGIENQLTTISNARVEQLEATVKDLNERLTNLEANQLKVTQSNAPVAKTNKVTQENVPVMYPKGKEVQILTTKDAAKLLGVSRTTIESRHSKDQLPGVIKSYWVELHDQKSPQGGKMWKIQQAQKS